MQGAVGMQRRVNKRVHSAYLLCDIGYHQRHKNVFIVSIVIVMFTCIAVVVRVGHCRSVSTLCFRYSLANLKQALARHLACIIIGQLVVRRTSDVTTR